MMIDNNKKSNLHNEWNMRIIATYFTNGIKRIFSKNLGRVIAIICRRFGACWNYSSDPTFSQKHRRRGVQPCSKGV